MPAASSSLPSTEPGTPGSRDDTSSARLLDRALRGDRSARDALQPTLRAVSALASALGSGASDEKQYDGLKAELQTLGFIGHYDNWLRLHPADNVWEARLSLLHTIRAATA